MDSLRQQLSETIQELKEQTEIWETQKAEMMEKAEREKQEMEQRHNEKMEEMRTQYQRQKGLVVRLGRENRSMKKVLGDTPTDKEGCFVFNWFKK